MKTLLAALALLAFLSGTAGAATNRPWNSPDRLQIAVNAEYAYWAGGLAEPAVTYKHEWGIGAKAAYELVPSVNLIANELYYLDSNTNAASVGGTVTLLTASTYNPKASWNSIERMSASARMEYTYWDGGRVGEAVHLKHEWGVGAGGWYALGPLLGLTGRGLYYLDSKSTSWAFGLSYVVFSPRK